MPRLGVTPRYDRRWRPRRAHPRMNYATGKKDIMVSATTQRYRMVHDPQYRVERVPTLPSIRESTLPHKYRKKAVRGKRLTAEEQKIIQELSPTQEAWIAALYEYELIKERRQLRKELRRRFRREAKYRVYQYENKQDYIDSFKKPDYIDEKGDPHYFLTAKKGRRTIIREYVVKKSGKRHYVYIVNPDGSTRLLHGKKRGFGFVKKEKAWSSALKSLGVDPEREWKKRRDQPTITPGVVFRGEKPRVKMLKERVQGNRKKRGVYKSVSVYTPKTRRFLFVSEQKHPPVTQKRLKEMGWKRHPQDKRVWYIPRKHMKVGSYEYNYFVNNILNSKDYKNIQKEFYTPDERLILARRGREVKEPKTDIKIKKVSLKERKVQPRRITKYRYYKRKKKGSKKWSHVREKTMKKRELDAIGAYEIIKVPRTNIEEEKEKIKSKHPSIETIYKKD